MRGMDTPRRLTSVASTLVAVAAVLCGCGGSPHPAATASPTPLVLRSSPSQAPSTSPSGTLPREAAAVQGGRYYAVFLAVASAASDDRLATARVRAKALGYEGGDGDIGCTPGAREQLRLPAMGSYVAFSVLFETRAQAQRLAAAYGSGVVGIAHVTAGCLD